jgi:hypothetical protein
MTELKDSEVILEEKTVKPETRKKPPKGTFKGKRGKLLQEEGVKALSNPEEVVMGTVVCLLVKDE